MAQARCEKPDQVARAVPCPICGRPATAHARPFCSVRCSDIDLSRWLRGSYAVAGGQQDADEDGDDTRLEREQNDTQE